ncbi:MAG: cytochrome c [Gemmatimonadota bacterium]|nr:cytochrome c [Gemmatimonadota bacterium]
MKLLTRATVGIAIAAAIAATSPGALAAQDHGPVIEYRQSVMDAFRTHMGGVNAATSGTAPMGHARYHAVAFHEMAMALANVFPQGSMSDDSRALAAIWENRDDFMNKVSDIQGAAQRLVAAAESGNPETIGAAVTAVQGTCRGCHTTYRGPAR